MKIKRYLTGIITVNTYLVYDENTKEGFIVDPGAYCPQLTKDAREEGVNIKYIILTHGHGDHIGGVAEQLKDFPEAKVIAHEAEAEMLAKPEYNLSKDCCRREISMSADIYVKDKETLKVGNMELTFIYTPGHTKGSVCYLYEDAVFSGDTLFRGTCGRCDFYGGNSHAMRDSLAKLATLEGDRPVYPGHEDETSLDWERKYNRFMGSKQ